MDWRKSTQNTITPFEVRLISLLTATWIGAGVASVAMADEFPPNCSKVDGGAGATSASGLNFSSHMAHLGDTVQVFPTLGMVGGACQAQHATGTVYVASGLLVAFLSDATLDPGFVYDCPTNSSPPCAVGPYNVTITPDLVGAAVVSPGGSIQGLPKQVRAIHWSFSDHVRTGDPEDSFVNFESASITVATPCIQVFKICRQTNQAVPVLGYVTNCGDISLTNVTAVDSEAGPLALLDPETELPLNAVNPYGPVSLPVGSSALFRYAPTMQEICGGLATNIVMARGTDTSDIGGPRASVSNEDLSPCVIDFTSVIGVTARYQTNAIRPGETLTIVGVVTNQSGGAVTNIFVYDDQPAPGTVVSGPITLFPRGSTTFTNSYTVPLGSCGPHFDTLTAAGSWLCGVAVSNRLATAYSVICPSVTINGPWITNGLFTFSFLTDSNRNYIVSYTDSLSPTNWRTRTNFAGDGTVATIHESLSSTQRFYRVQTQ